MRKGMLLLVCMAIALASKADAPTESEWITHPLSLLERALDLPFSGQDRPTGQCIYACGDRQILLRRCADGDCPEYDCQTGTATCRSR